MCRCGSWARLGPMPERGGDERPAVLADRAALAAAYDRRLPLQVDECRLPRALVRLAHFTANPLVLGKRMEQADALRAREDEVVAGDRGEPLLLLPPLAALHVEHANGDRALPHRRPQRCLARRVHAPKQRPEIAIFDDADETEPLGAATSPQARRLAPARVVVVQTTSDLLLVVRLLAQRQLRNAQHAGTPPGEQRAETHMHPRCNERCSFSKRATIPPYVLRTADAQNGVFSRRH